MSAQDLMGYEIPDVRQFPFRNYEERVAVYDRNFDPPRLVRKAGWLRCMRCQKGLFSQDVTRIRLCFPCRGRTTDDD